MNLFRSSNTASEELTLKVNALESLIKDLESGYSELKEANVILSETVQTLSEKLSEKEAIIEEKEVIISEQETVIDKQDELITEVIENTITIEKQSAIKAAVILGEMGAPVVETIDGPKEDDLVKRFKNLKGKELQEFYNQNKDAIMKSLNKR